MEHQKHKVTSVFSESPEAYAFIALVVVWVS